VSRDRYSAPCFQSNAGLLADNVDNLFKCCVVEFHRFWSLFPLLTTNVYISILVDEGRAWVGRADLESLNWADNVVRFLYIRVVIG
jgi:hypothetical protein